MAQVFFADMTKLTVYRARIPVVASGGLFQVGNYSTAIEFKVPEIVERPHHLPERRGRSVALATR